MNIKELYQVYKKTYLVSTDTRNLENGCVFFALKGDNFDANKFADKALENGASFVVIDNSDYYKNDSRYLLVEDVLKTLQDLAKYHRQVLGVPIIALTGSNGKTTTKELLHVVLSEKFKTSATKGNLNNHIGVPMTLLAMSPETELGIVEMGANHLGEIAFLCEIAMPNYGYITNFGKAHLEGFGSLEGVIKAKTELYQDLSKTNGIVFVNYLDKTQLEKSEKQKRHIFGNDIKNIVSSDFIKVQFDNTIVESNLLGGYNYSNLAASIGIGQFFGVSSREIKSALEAYVPTNKRSQLIDFKNTTIILDAYNANPTSMQAALSSFKNNPAKKKALILGDMFELGNSSEKEHQYIAELASTSGFNKVILIGENFFETRNINASKYRKFENYTVDFLQDDFKNTTILVKGSRGMTLERVLDLFD